MIVTKILRNLAIPSSCGIIVYAKEVQSKTQQEKEECDETRKLVKPSELPLYTEPPKPMLCRSEPPASFLYTTVSCARQELMAVLKQGQVVRSEIEDGIYEVIKEGEDVINYLREEDNLVPRVGAIALGGLTGYVSGLRKGFVKRLFRTGLGAAILAAICYPREAREYSEEAIRETKKYLIIAYHFVNGDDINYEQIEKQVKEEPLFFPEKQTTGDQQQVIPKEQPQQKESANQAQSATGAAAAAGCSTQQPSGQSQPAVAEEEHPPLKETAAPVESTGQQELPEASKSALGACTLPQKGSKAVRRKKNAKSGTNVKVAPIHPCRCVHHK